MRPYLLACLLLAHQTASHVIKSPRRSCSKSRNGKAVYLLTNDAENAVVALPIGRDGKLSNGTVTPSGGKGSNSIDGTTKQPAVPDALVSQSALSVAGQHVFAVNAGSNTLSMFKINRRDPTKLTMVGQPAAIPAEFPNTVAASTKNNLVCVGSTGATAGISCSSFSSSALGKMGNLVPINLGQTTPPVGPTNTISQVLFTEDESALLTMLKGDPAMNKTGFLSVLPVQCRGNSSAMASTVADQDIRSSPQGTAVLFGSTTLPETSNIFATDASFGATILAVDPTTRKASTLAAQAIDGQAATCWAAFSPVTGTVFVTDVGKPRIVEMSAEDASIVSQVDLSGGGDRGFIDLKAAGDFLYVLNPGNGTASAAVSVLDLSGGAGSAKLVQRFGLAGMAGANAQGLQILA